jgi:hypothetical protein
MELASMDLWNESEGAPSSNVYRKINTKDLSIMQYPLLHSTSAHQELQEPKEA